MGERFDDISLGSDRLRGVCPDFNFGREEMGTNLMKRRQKCGKRHNLEDQAKGRLSDVLSQLLATS